MPIFKLLLFILASVNCFILVILSPEISSGKERLINPVIDAAIVKVDTPLTFSQPLLPPVNILLLGVDGRKGDKNPRCDSIHMFSFLPQDKKLKITSMPRGTPVSKTGTYVANSCHTYGIDKTITEIENIMAIKHDYLVKVGFSQSLGIFRLLGLPPTDTLKYLRNRTLPRGDNQRSRNQAIFIRDQLINNLANYSLLPKQIKYLAFKLLDTDLEFEESQNYLDELLNSNFAAFPDRIEIISVPSPVFSLKEMHLENEDIKQVKVVQDDEEFSQYQRNVSDYLTALINRANSLLNLGKANQVYSLIQTPYSQKIWLQLENSSDRNQTHFNLLNLYVQTEPEKFKSSQDVLDFITEMEIAQENELTNKAQKLLELLTSSPENI